MATFKIHLWFVKLATTAVWLAQVVQQLIADLAIRQLSEISFLILVNVYARIHTMMQEFKNVPSVIIRAKLVLLQLAVLAVMEEQEEVLTRFVTVQHNTFMMMEWLSLAMIAIILAKHVLRLMFVWPVMPQNSVNLTLILFFVSVWSPIMMMDLTMKIAKPVPTPVRPVQIPLPAKPAPLLVSATFQPKVALA